MKWESPYRFISIDGETVNDVAEYVTIPKGYITSIYAIGSQVG